MTGNSNTVWLCLIGGMLLQLSGMVFPFQRWDWARYLGSAAFPMLVLAKADGDHVVVSAEDGLFLCGIFTFVFALLFQDRLLPRLAEGTMLMWTTILCCVIVEIGACESMASYIGLGLSTTAIVLLLVPRRLPFYLKIGLYGWFLVAVVAMSTLQFRGSDLSIIRAGRSAFLDYRFAFIDGMAGAYIGVHATYLYELLPIPGKNEGWRGFVRRWSDYLNQVASRLDEQRIDLRAALGIVIGVVLIAYANHRLQLLPDRTLCNVIILGLPMGWRAVASWAGNQEPLGAPATTNSPEKLVGGAGRARHSRKHRK